ncbi:hypothetical protein AO367_2002 [Moraxella catarrhalis]|nr:hypothetical protein AO378_0264 [Moraxella catarrhalis]OAV29291.1 hypothetical protein AO367_2002 [Moraxella catarrhalis]
MDAWQPYFYLGAVMIMIKNYRRAPLNNQAQESQQKMK